MAVFLNDQQLSLLIDNTVESGRILTGLYTVKIESPYYLDTTTTYQLQSGVNYLELNLKPAAEIVTEILKDYRTALANQNTSKFNF